LADVFALDGLAGLDGLAALDGLAGLDGLGDTVAADAGTAQRIVDNVIAPAVVHHCAVRCGMDPPASACVCVGDDVRTSRSH
jgi:hypothetical protein